MPNTCTHIELRANEKWKGEKSASVTLRCPLQPSWEGAAGSCLSAPPPPHIETAMLIVQCASAQCDLCIGTQLCIERSDTAVAGTVRRSAHSSVTVDPGGSAAGTSHHQHHPLSSTITILPLFLTASQESHNVVHDCSKRVQHAFCSYLPHLIYTTLCYIKPACWIYIKPI